MANQNPQPEIYTTQHDFTVAATQGTTDTQTAFTNQANTEEVRIYAISCAMMDGDDGIQIGNTDNDFQIRIRIGQSFVPFEAFDLGVIWQKEDKTLTFATPILVLYQQPISVEVTWANSSALDDDVIVKVSLHAELALQPGYPENSGMPNARRNY